MVERSMEHFDLYPERLIGDTAYGSAEMLDWLVHDRGIEPHIPVYDKSQRSDGTFSRGGCQVFCVRRSRETLYLVEGAHGYGTAN